MKEPAYAGSFLCNIFIRSFKYEPLNFSLLPDIPRFQSILVDFGEGKYPALTRLGILNDRINSCYHFIYNLFPKEENKEHRPAYFRAALNEFAGISQIFKEYKLDEIVIDNSDNPLMHFFKLLRDVSFHITTVAHETTNAQVAIYNIRKGNPEDQELDFFSHSFSTIPKEDLMYIMSSKNVKHYVQQQLYDLVEWVANAQSEWGIQYLFSIAMDNYCKIISDYLEKSPPFAVQ